MNEVKYGYTIQKDKAMRALAEQRTAQLEEVLGDLAPEVSAEWDKGEDAMVRPVVTLRLSDFSGWVMGVFEPKELENVPHMQSRFRLLWGDLLEVRRHQQLQQLLGGGQRGD